MNFVKLTNMCLNGNNVVALSKMVWLIQLESSPEWAKQRYYISVGKQSSEIWMNMICVCVFVWWHHGDKPQHGTIQWERINCWIVRLNLNKTLGIKILPSFSGRQKLCVLGLRLQRLKITRGKWGRRTCSAFWTTAIKRPLSAPSISESISTLSSAKQPALSPAYGRNSQSSLCHGHSSTGFCMLAPSGASIQNPVDGSDSRDLVINMFPSISCVFLCWRGPKSIAKVDRDIAGFPPGIHHCMDIVSAEFCYWLAMDWMFWNTPKVFHQYKLQNHCSGNCEFILRHCRDDSS